MPIQTNLSGNPYFDDFNVTNNYSKILFKPGIAVQTRELNQLQTVLQNQVEQFGDNILKRGTIVEGCNFTFMPNYPYIKLADTQVDNTPTNVNNYVNNYIINTTTGLAAYILGGNTGYVSTAPYLNTIYLKYINSGYNYNTTQFSVGDTLQIYNNNYPINNVNIIGAGSSYANTDSVIFVDSILVYGNSSAFTTGQYIWSSGGGNATITGVYTTNAPGYYALTLQPNASDLQASGSPNTQAWSFSSGSTVTQYSQLGGQGTAGPSATVANSIGTGASASLITNTYTGAITSVVLNSTGNNYSISPSVFVRSATGSGASLVAQNYIAQVTIPSSVANPVGNGYAFGVTDGVIYQKGYFSQVSSQTIVVSPYSSTPDAVSVGFDTAESIVTAYVDPSLYDNAVGTDGYLSPGADRLQLTPTLTVLTTTSAASNTDFLPLVTWSQGQPYQQNQQTQYNVIEDEMAQRTYDVSGDFVIDPFLVTSKTTTTASQANSTFNIVVNPGEAYIGGYRVKTNGNYYLPVNKGIDTNSVSAVATSLIYNNYIDCQEIGGMFKFTTGDLVTFYDTANQFISNAAGGYATGTISPVGNIIGTARIRSQVVLPGGIQGTPTGSNRLYLFDVAMSNGANFRSVKSVVGTSNSAIADVILAVDTTTGTNVAKIVNTNSTLLFPSGTASMLKSTANHKFQYRTTATIGSFSGNSVSITLTGSNTFPYTPGTTLNSAQDIIVVPTATIPFTTLLATTNGQTSSTANSIILASSGGATNLYVGDYLQISNATSTTTNRITALTVAGSSVTVNLDSVPVATTSTANATQVFPNNVPIPIDGRPNRYVNVNSSAQTLTIQFAQTFISSYPLSISYNANTVASSPDNITINRNNLIKIVASNNASGDTGPWNLGVPGVFRLRNVFLSSPYTQSIDAQANVSGSATSSARITISNNVFANGDSFTYSNSAVSAGLSGLTNGTTYFAVYANSTGFSVSTTSGGSNVTFNSSAVAGNVTFTGVPLKNIGPSTQTLTDVTNMFYVDSNQKTDYMDLSLLYRKPGVSLPLAASNSALLVVYDNFTIPVSSTVKTVSSYNVNVNTDAANSTTLTTSYVNAVEVPEITGGTGAYYDLINTIDFRPSVVNTVAITNSTSSAPINPPSSNSTTKFSGVTFNFPVPGSSHICDQVSYLGRVDSIVVTGSGQVLDSTGTPGTLIPPPTPSAGITISLVKVPAYPSIPQNMSSDYLSILDTKVASQSYSLQRIANQTVVAPFVSNTGNNAVQVSGYTMSDIANLERRIYQLEQYVSLSQLEQSVQNVQIPSSITATTNRFKYGFFADDFSSTQYTDTTNPENTAVVNNGLLVPFQAATNIPIDFVNDFGATSYSKIGNAIVLPYVETRLVKQTAATNGAVPPPSPVVVQQTMNAFNSGFGVSIDTFKASATSNTCSFVFSRDWWYGYRGYIIFQTPDPESDVIYHPPFYAGGYPGYNSSYALTGVLGFNGDGSIPLSSNTIGLNQYVAAVSNSPGNFAPIGSMYQYNFTHDPSKGQYYKIYTYNRWWEFEYYNYRFSYPVDTIQYPSTTTSAVVPSTYSGTLIPSPSTFQLYTYSYAYAASGVYLLTGYVPYPWYYGVYGLYNGLYYYANQQKFDFAVTGLRPSTKHTFTFDGTDQTALCKQFGGTLGGGLVSDQHGQMEFSFYFGNGINSTTTGLSAAQALSNSLAASKVAIVATADNSSTAQATINVIPASNYVVPIGYDYCWWPYYRFYR